MRKTGRATQNLTAQLHETVERQREEFETATRTELRKLVTALRQSSSVALSGLENDFKDQLSTIHSDLKMRVQAMDWEINEIRDRPRRIILISALTAAIISAIFWSGPRLWTMWRLSGVSVQTDPSGTFLILPPTAQTGWTCHGIPCVKLED